MVSIFVCYCADDTHPWHLKNVNVTNGVTVKYKEPTKNILCGRRLRDDVDWRSYARCDRCKGFPLWKRIIRRIVPE